MDETNFRLADGRNFGYIVVPVDEINFRLTVRRKLLISPVSHLLFSLLNFLSHPSSLGSLSLSRRRGWSAAGRGGRRAPGARVAARQQAEVGAAAGRGRARRQGEAVRGCRARPAAGGPRRAGGRARPASGASCRGVWAALCHTPGQPQQAGGGSREVEHGTAGAAA